MVLLSKKRLDSCFLSFCEFQNFFIFSSSDAGDRSLNFFFDYCRPHGNSPNKTNFLAAKLLPFQQFKTGNLNDLSSGMANDNNSNNNSFGFSITPMTSFSCFFSATQAPKKYIIKFRGPAAWHTLPFEGVASKGITYLSFTIGASVAGNIFFSVLLAKNQKEYFQEANEKKTTFQGYPGQANTSIAYCHGLLMSNSSLYYMGSYIPTETAAPAWSTMIGKKVGLLIDYPRNRVMVYYVDSDNSVLWKHTLISGIKDFDIIPLLTMYYSNDYVTLGFDKDDKKPTEIEDLEKEFERMREG